MKTIILILSIFAILLEGEDKFWDKNENFISNKQNKNIWISAPHFTTNNILKFNKTTNELFDNLFVNDGWICLAKVDTLTYRGKEYNKLAKVNILFYDVRLKVIEMYSKETNELGKLSKNNIAMSVTNQLSKTNPIFGEYVLMNVSSEGDIKGEYYTLLSDDAYISLNINDIEKVKSKYHLKPLYSTLQSSNPKTLSFENYQKSIQPFLPPKNDFEKKVVRNLPFATRGYIFQDKKVQAFYENIEWYKPNKEYKSNINDLSEAEKEWIQKYEVEVNN